MTARREPPRRDEEMPGYLRGFQVTDPRWGATAVAVAYVGSGVWSAEGEAAYTEAWKRWHAAQGAWLRAHPSYNVMDTFRAPPPPPDGASDW